MQSLALELIDAWQKPSPAGVNANKFFMNVAGVPVGGARLPSVPLDTPTAKALRASFADFCAGPAAKANLQMCAHTAQLAQQMP